MFEHKYQIRNISQPAPDLVLLNLVTQNGEPIFDYRPGQYVMISYRNEAGHMEEKHSFSIASSPTEQGVLRLGIRVMGKFTQGLVKLKPGAEILTYGPFGSFSFNETLHTNAVFLAGGIGITPFLSALAYATDKKLPNKLSLLYSNRTLKGTAFFTDLSKIKNDNPNVKMLFSVTDEKVPVKAEGIINERFCNQNLKDFIGATEAKTFFLCGPMPFMTGMKNCLLELGAKDEQILMEEFSMIGNRTTFSKLRYAMAMTGYGALAALLPFYVIYAANSKGYSQPVATSLVNDPVESDEESKSIINSIVEHLPIQDDIKQASTTQGDNSVKADTALGKFFSNIVKTESKPKPVAPVGTKTTTSAPAPTTGSSVPAKTTTTNLNTQTTPVPTTAVSGTQPTTQATAQTNTQVPSPTTAASGAAVSSPSQATNPAANTAPTPVTTASGAVISGGTTGSAAVTSATNTSRDEEDDD